MSLPVTISTEGNNQIGYGHIKRSIWLAKMLKDSFGIESHLLVNPNSAIMDILKKEKIPYTSLKSKKAEKKYLLSNKSKILFVDKRDTFNLFYRGLPFITVGFDNFGKDASFFDYVINPLPSFKKNEVNFKNPKYLFFPEEFWNYQKPRVLKPVTKILIAFGGTDPTDLSYLMEEIFGLIKEVFELTIVLGPLYKGKLCPEESRFPSIKIIGPQENLYALMKASDLVITYFGLTAYEAAIIGVPIFLVNPFPYHEKLSLHAGFVTGGIGSFANLETIKEKLKGFLANPRFINFDEPTKGNIDFKLLLKNLLAKEKDQCPVCHTSHFIIYKRDNYDNIYFCEKDKIYFRNNGYDSKMEYSANYFVEDYKKQYGKTYEQDRPNIDQLNQKRLKIIQKLLKNKGYKKNLFEVGAALGFFMDMADKTGEFQTEGVEISPYAVDYARSKLKLNMTCNDFLQMKFNHPYIDLLVMWYYIEHNSNLIAAIEKIKQCLKIGGILALSTPNADGISSRKYRAIYAKIIPMDHYYEFSPKGLKRFMARQGFKLLKLQVTGIHTKRWIKQPFAIINKILAFIMKKRKLGDTFEAYFLRVK